MTTYPFLRQSDKIKKFCENLVSITQPVQVPKRVKLRLKGVVYFLKKKKKPI